jgi:hypothetical protein
MHVVVERVAGRGPRTNMIVDAPTTTGAMETNPADASTSTPRR